MPILCAVAAEPAAAVELEERYVREWLGAMTTGGVVEYDWGPPVPDAILIDDVLPLFDGLPELLTKGIDVADIGC